MPLSSPGNKHLLIIGSIERKNGLITQSERQRLLIFSIYEGVFSGLPYLELILLQVYKYFLIKNEYTKFAIVLLWYSNFEDNVSLIKRVILDVGCSKLTDKSRILKLTDLEINGKIFDIFQYL